MNKKRRVSSQEILAGQWDIGIAAMAEPATKLAEAAIDMAEAATTTAETATNMKWALASGICPVSWENNGGKYRGHFQE